MKTVIDKQWQQWLEANISRGCDKQVLLHIMLEHQFHPDVAQKALGLSEVDQNQLQAYIQSKKIMQKEKRTVEPIISVPEFRFKNAKKVITDKARIYIQEDFLNKTECEKIIKRIQSNLRPSLITQSDELDQYFRTSQTCDLGIQADDFISNIDQKIADYLGINTDYSEIIQGQFYEIGNEFKLHTDYFQPNTEEFQEFASDQGQRTWTFMIYLNDVAAGGHTDFPKLDLSVKPKQGRAVIWSSLYENGGINPNTLHWAKPIIKGQKYVITKWFREMARIG